jgi:two-component system, cell cycle sensor histidine kinase and response regulator CckA
VSNRGSVQVRESFQPQTLRIVELNSVVSTIAKTLPRLIGEDIDFTFTPGEGVGRVRIDPIQLEQVLVNLAANARDAMPQGSHLQIETSDIRLDESYIHGKPAVIPKGHYALISVSDDGKGIPPEDLPHILNRSIRRNPRARAPGLDWPRLTESSSRTTDSSGFMANLDQVPSSKSICLL